MSKRGCFDSDKIKETTTMNKKPVLSEKDKKNTITAKKKSKVILKNLLAQPFEKYWPELTANDVDDFVATFRMQYKSRSNTSTSSDDNNVSNGFENKLKIGLQSSIRCILSSQRLALFISTKIRPKHITDQIISMALTQNRKSKIFCVPNMDEALMETLGFPCQCLAILENGNVIWNWILEKSKHFPIPKNYIHVASPKMEQMEVDYSKPPAMARLNDDKVDFAKLYLRKENTNERAFIPQGTVREVAENETDFISLGETNKSVDSVPTIEMIRKMKKMKKLKGKAGLQLKNLIEAGYSQKQNNFESISRKKVNYVPLKVNKVRPNPDKNRNKKNKKNKK